MNEIRKFDVWIGAVFALLVALVAYFSFRVGVGSPRFSYTLDDPFIHLRLSQEIARGHYGINPSEFSSPSSSILWPFLLVPFIATALAIYAPLAINVVCLLAFAWVAYRAFQGGPAAAIKVIALVLATNSLGLVFTGMEHSLQLLLTVICAAGLLQEVQTDKIPKWLIAALILQPLIRYENFGITLAIATFLFFRGHRKEALVAIVIPAIVAIGFSLFLHSLGLGFLPNSIVAKTNSLQGSALTRMLVALQDNMAQNRLLFRFEASLAFLCLISFKKCQWVGVVACAVLIMHLLVGKYGWFDRYEQYVNAFLLVLALQAEVAVWKGTERIYFIALGIFASLWFGFPSAEQYMFRAKAIPIDAANISNQQLQMHRFTNDFWRKPVGVNDLGWVSWDDPNYVLDLWGLGSASALKLRLGHSGKDVRWMDDICKSHNVKLCMLFHQWFPYVPPNWVEAGKLIRGHGGQMDEVYFLVTDPRYLPEVRADMAKFAQTLPPGAKIIVNPN